MRYKHDIFAVAEARSAKKTPAGVKIVYGEGEVLAPADCKIVKGTALEIYHPLATQTGNVISDLIISNPPGICQSCPVAAECDVLAKGAVQGEGMAKEFVHIIEV